MNFDDIKVLLEQNKLKEIMKVLKASWKGPMNIYEQQIINLSGRWDQHHKEVTNGLTLSETINDIKNDIFSFAKEVSELKLDNNTIKNLLESKLLIDNNFPFMDRVSFRNELGNILASDKAQIFVVDGEEKSGMSHFELFLTHVNNNLKIFNFIPLEIPEILAEPDTLGGELLAEIMCKEMGIEMDFDDDSDSIIKFTQFNTKLKEKIRSDDKIPMFFLHDFHRLKGDNDNLQFFIYFIIKRIYNNFPRSVFIFAGLNYVSLKMWDKQLKLMVKVYKMESTTPEDAKKCLKCIFDEYQEKVVELFKSMFDTPISEAQYIEVMIEDLKKDNNSWKIEKVGEKLKEHLYALKN